MADLWSNPFERVVNRALIAELGDSVFKKSVALDRAFGKRELKTGTQIEIPISTGTDGQAAMFSPHGFDTDAAGSTSSGTSGNVDFREMNRVINLVVPFKAGGTQMRISEIRLRQSKGAEEKMDYLKLQASGVKNSLKNMFATQFITGSPEGTGSSTDISGLKALFETLSGSTSVAYMSQSRSGSDALYPVVMDARSTGSAYTTGSISGVSGANFVTGSGSSWFSTTFPGDELEMAGDSTIYRVVNVISNTSLEVTPDIASTLTTVAFTISRCFTNTTEYGNSGVVTLEKLDKCFWATQDGGDAPTIALSGSPMFSRVANKMIQNQRYMGQSNKVGVNNYESFKYHSADYVIDNFMPNGTVYFLNEDYNQVYALRGMDTPQLEPGSLVKDYSSFQRASMIAEVNVVWNYACRALNRQGKISGFTA